MSSKHYTPKKAADTGSPVLYTNRTPDRKLSDIATAAGVPVDELVRLNDKRHADDDAKHCSEHINLLKQETQHRDLASHGPV